MTIMILKLRPDHDEAYPPGYLNMNPHATYVPHDFDGHKWIENLPNGVKMADIFKPIRQFPDIFSSDDIWWYATLPATLAIHAGEYDYTIVRSIVRHPTPKNPNNQLLILAHHRYTGSDGNYGYRVVGRVGADSREALGEQAVIMIRLAIESKHPDDLDYYRLPAVIKHYYDKEFSPKSFKRLVP